VGHVDLAKTTLVRLKIKQEFRDFRMAMLKRKPLDIFNSASIINEYNDLKDMIEMCDFSDEALDTMLKTDHILDSLYEKSIDFGFGSVGISTDREMAESEQEGLEL